MLNREHEVLTLSSKIQTEVATSISKTQRDFFLREQMRAIRRELGESDPNASEIQALRETDSWQIALGTASVGRLPIRKGDPFSEGPLRGSTKDGAPN